MAHLNAEQILCFFKGLTLFFMYGPDSIGLYKDEVQIFVVSLNNQVKWVPSITPIRIIPKINYLSGTMNLLCFVIWKPFLEQVTHCLGLSVLFLVNCSKSRNHEGVHILDVPIMMAKCTNCIQCCHSEFSSIKKWWSILETPIVHTCLYFLLTRFCTWIFARVLPYLSRIRAFTSNHTKISRKQNAG